MTHYPSLAAATQGILCLIRSYPQYRGPVKILADMVHNAPCYIAGTIELRFGPILSMAQHQVEQLRKSLSCDMPLTTRQQLLQGAQDFVKALEQEDAARTYHEQAADHP